MSLVSAQDESSSASSNFVASRSIDAKAVFDTSTLSADSDYVSAKQNVYVWLDAVEPISFIDSLLCFTNQSQPLVMVGEGDYISWNDASRCFEDKGGQGGGDDQGGGEQAQQFVTIVGNSSQESSSDPLIYHGWVEDYAGQSGEGGGPTGIKIRGEVRKTPTEANPFGEFTLTYGLLPSISATEDDNQGFGEVTSSESTDGGASFTLYQEDNQNEQGTDYTCITSASVDYDEATETGLARTGRECAPSSGGDVVAERSGAFALAVNSDHVHMAKASTFAAIDAETFDDEVCLARDSFNNVVWNYSIYNKADGSAVDVNSGMQIKVDGNGAGDGADSDGFESWGHIGYWGSWREDGQSFADGETVQQATFDDTVGDNFTVKVAPGRLVKNTVESLNLSTLDGVTFSTWIYEGDTYLLSAATDFNGDADTNDGFEVMLEANSTNDGFEVTGVRTFTENGEQITAVNPAVAVPLNSNIVLNMWSRQLGGNVRYLADASAIRFFTRNFVNGGETATGELFDGTTSVTLKCFDRCLDADLVAADVSGSANQEDVFVSNSYSAAQDYTFAQADLTLKLSSVAVGYASSVTKSDVESSQHWSWGLNSGPMISSSVATAETITTAGDLYAAIEAGDVVEFYQWETGLEPWQQQMVLIDGSSDVVSFDPPITIKYTHATANDRNGDASQDGKVFLLEYGGKGQLWGLPFEEGSEGRWGPVINLKDGTILGASDQYIIKANDVEQRMAVVDSANCSSLPLDAPSQSVPTEITGDVFGIGAMPDISDEPPTVVDGELVE
ncbi:hypothetical protein NBRC116188_09750 [Oceaniserpentilla sp. 4NH20-0058]